MLIRAVAWCLVALVLSPPSHGRESPQARPILREAVSLTIAGSAESWRLEWTDTPTPYCHVGEIYMAMTCPCDGLAYGEAGSLELVRSRRPGPDETMSLDPLFRGVGIMTPIAGSGAVLPKLPYRESDFARDSRKDPTLAGDISRRPIKRIMQMADYNHDGWEAKFLLQVDEVPCGRRRFVAVGVTKARPYLHALGSKAWPEQPLILAGEVWMKLRHGVGPFNVLTWPCGEEGGETESRVLVRVENGELDVMEEEWSCPTRRRPRHLISRWRR